MNAERKPVHRHVTRQIPAFLIGLLSGFVVNHYTADINKYIFNLNNKKNLEEFENVKLELSDLDHSYYSEKKSQKYIKYQLIINKMDKFVEVGIPRAATFLSLLYHCGRGDWVKKDEYLSLKYQLKAMEMGDVLAGTIKDISTKLCDNIK